jgi:hypothetical protein
MVHFKQEDESDRDPRTPSNDFHISQKLIVDIIAVVQDFAKIFTRPFVEGIVMIIRCIMILARALMSGNSDDFKKFFQTIMDYMAESFIPMIENFGKMLPAEGSPFRPICTALEALKTGICNMVQADWIPNGVNIKCGNDIKCSWWDFNDKDTGEIFAAPVVFRHVPASDRTESTMTDVRAFVSLVAGLSAVRVRRLRSPSAILGGCATLIFYQDLTCLYTKTQLFSR